MAVQTVFKRYETKFMLTQAQKQILVEELKPYMKPDAYGRTTVRNLYYDTDSYLLIRRSMEKPVYKEKLRLRSYSRVEGDSQVFVELKKKYQSVVYKRRLVCPYREAISWLSGERKPEQDSQIAREIDYALQLYGQLHPTVFLSYEREAYYATDGSDLRLTFDDTILVRQKELSLEAPPYGTPILPEGKVLMEVKSSGAIPLWLTRVLSRERIYKTSFSKYATAYRDLIFPQTHSVNPYHMQEVTSNA